MCVRVAALIYGVLLQPLTLTVDPAVCLHSAQVKDTGEVQVEAVLLVPPFIPAHDLFDQGGHHQELRSLGPAFSLQAGRRRGCFLGQNQGASGPPPAGLRSHIRGTSLRGELQKLRAADGSDGSPVEAPGCGGRAARD
ncbi:hypothetical protein PBY51_001253 [Eleginops maclovinus]|uniref:Secreted protein n=1 Tax=Eleginops maclovinus TaxID=56733 RepID=A0AAN7WZF7_ELEMC|nr:hypothetical protein PBY51_001253 [Eleginops maclovinus]